MEEIRNHLTDKILRLKDGTDREYLRKRLGQYSNLPLSPQEIEKAISFLDDNLDEEWLTVYPMYTGGLCSIKTGTKHSDSLNFLREVIPLALSLIVLSDTKGFSSVIQKLKMPAYDRISTIPQVMAAARYKKAGYEVELEPKSENSKSSDFRVKLDEEWIYFECKRENLHESQYMKKAANFANELMTKILQNVEPKLRTDYRIDIIVITSNQRNEILDKLPCLISDCFQNKEFNAWKNFGGIKYAVNSRNTVVDPPLMGIRQYQMTVGATPKKLSQENMDIQVVYNPFGIKELQKIRRMIKEAKEQLPKSARGVIILETWHTERTVPVVEERLRSVGYEHVAVTLVTGNGAWSVPNPLHQSFPFDFIKTAVLPDFPL